MDLADRVLPPDRCPVCGFQSRCLLPHDAIRIVRALPRRWDELFGRYQGDDGDVKADWLLSDLGNGPSALRHGVLAADALACAARDLATLWRHEAEPSESRVGPVSRPATPFGVVVDLVAEARSLLAQADRRSGRDWLLTTPNGSRPVSALEILRRAVHESVHRLREAEHGLVRLAANAGADGLRPDDVLCSAA